MQFCRSPDVRFPAPLSQTEDLIAYGRTCVTVVDSKTKAESVLTADLKPAAECTVAVHLEANTAGKAIIAAFSKIDGTLANGWLPVIVQLEDWEEQTAPPAREPWA
jgi:hypothetical protein